MGYKLELASDFEYFKDELINIKDIFKSSNNSIHKARNELKIVELSGVKYVVKAFKIPHLLNRFAYTYIRDGKAKKSFLNGIKLQKLGVNTPKPVGFIEFFEFGLLKESFFVSIYEPYDFTIREVFHHKVEDISSILKEFAKFSYELHKKGVWHVDYSLGNILITKVNGSYRFSLVDINRMEFKTIPPKDGLKNFNKFWAKDVQDLKTIAIEYARLSGIDENVAVDIVLEEAKKLEAKVNLKRKLKKH